MQRMKIHILIYVVIVAVAAVLRAPFWFDVPPSLYWEEVALGYDAYSLALTGKDHHGTVLPVVALESFGDWKPAGYVYALVPFIWIFGLHDWVVRLPSAMAGVALVIAVGELVVLVSRVLLTKKELGISKQSEWWLRVLGVAVAALSPWGLQFSRAAWEVNLATALCTWACVLFVSACLSQKKSGNTLLWRLILGTVLLVYAMYTYHAARLVAPLLGVGMLSIWMLSQVSSVSLQSLSQVVQQRWKTLSIMVAIGVVALVPFITAPAEVVSSRFATTSIFSDPSLIERSNTYRELSDNSVISRLLYHRYRLYAQAILSNYLDHFDLGFLFVHGDANPRHSIQYFGHLYYVDALFLLFGCLLLLRRKVSVSIAASYAVVTILPASLTLATPHALRTLFMLPLYLVLIVLGMWYLFVWLTEFVKQYSSSMLVLKILVLGFGVVYLSHFVGYWRFFTVIYPVEQQAEWQYGYKEMVVEVKSLQDQYPDATVYISREYGRPAMYYWYYSQEPPQAVQAADASSSQDQSEFTEYQNIQFVDTLNPSAPALMVAPPEKFSPELREASTQQTVITGLDGSDVWEIRGMGL